jgi:hypothetical protein
MKAIHKVDGKADIDEDACVECHICYYSGVCPKNALTVEELSYPRSIREAFSDVRKPHKSTGVLGRGTEEIKTNDVTARLKYGRVSVSVELGRPGIGTDFYDVQTIAQKLAPIGVHFEPENPVTSLMADAKTGTMKPEVLPQRALSALLEMDMPLETLRDVLHALKEVEGKIHTVFSLCVATPLDPETGENPAQKIMEEEHIPYRPNGKTNVGLGKPFKGVVRI